MFFWYLYWNSLNKCPLTKDIGQGYNCTNSKYSKAGCQQGGGVSSFSKINGLCKFPSEIITYK